MEKHVQNTKRLMELEEPLVTPMDFAEIEHTAEKWIEKRSATISTFTGLTIDLLNPTPDMICIEDVAHGLSNTCRWGGQCTIYYSVAQHSVWCAMNVHPSFMLEALLHDAAEAYIGDLTTPLKKALPCYKKVEDAIMQCVATKFGISYHKPPEVQYVDDKAKQYELTLLSNINIDTKRGLLPFQAEEEFLIMYDTILKKQANV